MESSSPKITRTAPEHWGKCWNPEVTKMFVTFWHGRRDRFDFLFPEVFMLNTYWLWSWWPEYYPNFFLYLFYLPKSKNKPVECSIEISPEAILNILDLHYVLLVFFLLNNLLKNKAKPNKQKANQTFSKKGSCWKDTNLSKQGTPKKFP